MVFEVWWVEKWKRYVRLSLSYCFDHVVAEDVTVARFQINVISLNFTLTIDKESMEK